GSPQEFAVAGTGRNPGDEGGGEGTAKGTAEVPDPGRRNVRFGALSLVNPVRHQPWRPPPNQTPQQTAAAISVCRSSTALGAAAAADLDRSAQNTATHGNRHTAGRREPGNGSGYLRRQITEPDRHRRRGRLRLRAGGRAAHSRNRAGPPCSGDGR